MVDLRSVVGLLTRLGPEPRARVVSYLLAPALAMGVAVAKVYKPWLAIDLARPVSISELITEVDTSGVSTSRRGLAITMDPSSSEYTVPLSGVSKLWTSVGKDILRANAGRFVLEPRGFHGRPPFLGVSTPVTVIVDGAPTGDVLVPGGTASIREWAAQPQRSLALVSSVFFSFVLAFGMAIGTALPSKGAK